MIEGGYTKKILRVDLSTRTVTTTVIGDEILNDFIEALTDIQTTANE